NLYKMKTLIYKIILFFIIGVYSSIAFTQNNTIDSLQKVLRTQKEDSNKVNTLNELSNTLLIDNNYKNAMQFANEALLLSRKINFNKGEGIAYNNIGHIYHEQGNN